MSKEDLVKTWSITDTLKFYPHYEIIELLLKIRNHLSDYIKDYPHERVTQDDYPVDYHGKAIRLADEEYFQLFEIVERMAKNYENTI